MSYYNWPLLTVANCISADENILSSKPPIPYIYIHDPIFKPKLILQPQNARFEGFRTCIAGL